MAKKKATGGAAVHEAPKSLVDMAGRGKNAATKRWGTITREEIAARVDKLEEIKRKLSSMILVADTFRVEDPIRIDGATKWDNSIGEIEKFVQNVEDGIIAARNRVR